MQHYLVLRGGKINNIFRSLVIIPLVRNNAHLKRSAASSALGLVAVGTRLPPSDVLEAAGVRGWLPLMSLLTRS